jgi:hypothetical protein
MNEVERLEQFKTLVADILRAQLEAATAAHNIHHTKPDTKTAPRRVPPATKEVAHEVG